jgi:hypothetical protein
MKLSKIFRIKVGFGESMPLFKCKFCKDKFEARQVDRNRGWARFCCKSCKAKYQTSYTSVCRHPLNDDDDGSWDAHACAVSEPGNYLTIDDFSDES